jgi:5-methylcytosine-specific restriction endonuclease McrA
MKAWDEPESDTLCALCGRHKPLTFHHLIPRTCHSNKWFRKRFTAEEMRSRGVDLCYDCHDYVHKTFGEKELGRHYNTLAALSAEEGVARFVDWVKRQR